jgi:hypothetical protein
VLPSEVDRFGFEFFKDLSDDLTSLFSRTSVLNGSWGMNDF